jgi:DNA-binding NarL/FixJ family response regulator
MLEKHTALDSALRKGSPGFVQEGAVESLASLFPPPSPARADGAVRARVGTRTKISYWKQRLIQRPYPEARLGRPPEYSARIEHDGAYNYFPLGSQGEDLAAAKALEIYQTVVQRGWKAAYECFEREVTLAIFWCDNPSAVTYTTLFTFDGSPPELPAPAKTKIRRKVAIIEPDLSVQSTVRFWLDRQAGFTCPAVFSQVAESLASLPSEPADLMLVNRGLPNVPETLAELKARWPHVPVFTYRIHEDSDQIFISISGVTGGYILRRRVPTALFDPIRAGSQQKTFSAPEAFRHVREYFQSFFGNPVSADNHLTMLHLTAREQEILNHVGKGYLDKEIAGALSLSVFTVHNHLKNIYEKLGVHNRTEAVLKYLQK